MLLSCCWCVCHSAKASRQGLLGFWSQLWQPQRFGTPRLFTTVATAEDPAAVEAARCDQIGSRTLLAASYAMVI